MTKRLIFVLGMHRAGTSTIARGLQALGAHLGNNLMPPGRDNPRGFFEDMSIVKLNDDILRRYDRTWKAAAPIGASELSRESLGANFYERAHDILAGLFAEHDIVAIKDPRVTMLLPFWGSVTRDLYRVNSVIALRHPLSVAASLWQRDRMPLEDALHLWTAYYRNFELSMPSFWGATAIINYDQLLLDSDEQLRHISEWLNLPRPSDESLASYKVFISPELRHSHLDTEEIPHPAAAKSWHRLSEAAVYA